MKTNNVDFGKSFKFKTDYREHDLIYTCNAVDDKGGCVVSWDWGKGGGTGSTEYDFSSVIKYIKEGSWIVLPSEHIDNSHKTEKPAENNLLDEIKAFTATSNHSVFIHDGYFEVYQAGLTEFPYKCKDDETLRSVVQALKVLDSVETDF